MPGSPPTVLSSRNGVRAFIYKNFDTLRSFAKVSGSTPVVYDVAATHSNLRHVTRIRTSPSIVIGTFRDVSREDVETSIADS